MEKSDSKQQPQVSITFFSKVINKSEQCWVFLASGGTRGELLIRHNNEDLNLKKFECLEVEDLLSAKWQSKIFTQCKILLIIPDILFVVSIAHCFAERNVLKIEPIMCVTCAKWQKKVMFFFSKSN